MKSIFTTYLQVGHFQFEYYCGFVNSINTKAASSAFGRTFQGVFHAYPIKVSVIKSFLKSVSKTKAKHIVLSRGP